MDVWPRRRGLRRDGPAHMTIRRRILAGLGPFGLMYGCLPSSPPTPAHRAPAGTTSVVHPLERAAEAVATIPPTTTPTEPPAPVTTDTIANMPATTRRTTTATTFVMPEAEVEES